jgi:hypothetical protein
LFGLIRNSNLKRGLSLLNFGSSSLFMSDVMPIHSLPHRGDGKRFVVRADKRLKRRVAMVKANLGLAVLATRIGRGWVKNEPTFQAAHAK